MEGKDALQLNRKSCTFFSHARRRTQYPRTPMGLTLRLPKPQFTSGPTMILGPLLNYRSEIFPPLPVQPCALVNHVWSQHRLRAQKPTHNNPTIPTSHHSSPALLLFTAHGKGKLASKQVLGGPNLQIRRAI